jgi:hypothetical protein
LVEPDNSFFAEKGEKCARAKRTQTLSDASEQSSTRRDFLKDATSAAVGWMLPGSLDLRRSWMKEIGTVPVDEGWIASDPPRMAEAVRQVNKPTLAYKVLAAGRKCGAEDEKRRAIKWAYDNIKPIEATIIGLYPLYSDQVAETTTMVREILA